MVGLGFVGGIVVRPELQEQELPWQHLHSEGRGQGAMRKVGVGPIPPQGRLALGEGQCCQRFAHDFDLSPHLLSFLGVGRERCP